MMHLRMCVQVGSYAFVSGQSLTSYGFSSAQIGSYQGSQQIGSYQLSSARPSSFQVGSYTCVLFVAVIALGTVYIHSRYHSEAVRAADAIGGTHMVGVIALNTGLNHDIVVDSFAGSILHFYSFNYEPGYKVWQEHGSKVKETLETVWAPKP